MRRTSEATPSVVLEAKAATPERGLAMAPSRPRPRPLAKPRTPSSIAPESGADTTPTAPARKPSPSASTPMRRPCPARVAWRCCANARCVVNDARQRGEHVDHAAGAADDATSKAARAEEQALRKSLWALDEALGRLVEKLANAVAHIGKDGAGVAQDVEREHLLVDRLECLPRVVQHNTRYERLHALERRLVELEAVELNVRVLKQQQPLEGLHRVDRMPFLSSAVEPLGAAAFNASDVTRAATGSVPLPSPARQEPPPKRLPLPPSPLDAAAPEGAASAASPSLSPESSSDRMTSSSALDSSHSLSTPQEKRRSRADMFCSSRVPLEILRVDEVQTAVAFVVGLVHLRFERLQHHRMLRALDRVVNLHLPNEQLEVDVRVGNGRLDLQLQHRRVQQLARLCVDEGHAEACRARTQRMQRRKNEGKNESNKARRRLHDRGGHKIAGSGIATVNSRARKTAREWAREREIECEIRHQRARKLRPGSVQKDADQTQK
eukprot:6069429-Pleurochrysis_carterae.AAC.2